MADSILNGLPDEQDDLLDRAIRAVMAVAPPEDTRRRLIESAAVWTTTPKRTPARRATRGMWIAAVAVLLFVSISFAVYFAVSHTHPVELKEVEMADTGERNASSPGPAVRNVHAGDAQSKLNPNAYLYRVSNLQAVVAENAPVIVTNGPEQPIPIGAAIAHGEPTGALHVWNWSESPQSRIVPNVELWMNDRIAISPDGRMLLWANGDILDLKTRDKTSIDLGEADIKIGPATYTRNGAMQFSPDGRRLAVRIIDMDVTRPGLISGEVVQVFEFPGGKPLGEIPAGESHTLRIGFSADGGKIVSGDRSRNVTLYDATTGEVLQKFAPAFDVQVMGVAISPDGSHVAACDRSEFLEKSANEKQGSLFLWNAASGRLVHHIDGSAFRKLNGHGPLYGELRFSPDGKFLAAESWGRVFVIDVTTGEIAAALRDDARSLQWSADGSTITVVTAVMLGPAPGGGDEEFDVYPSVHEWDWRSGKLVRSLTSPEPKVQ